MFPMAWWMIALMVVFTLVSTFLLKPKPPSNNVKPGQLSGMPTAEEGRPMPVLFGTRIIKDASCTFFGHLKTVPIKKSDQKIGYWYYAGVQLILWLGSVDFILAIFANEKELWRGKVSANTRINISKPAIFGGIDGEGGCVGDVDVCFGRDDQQENDYLHEAVNYELKKKDKEAEEVTVPRYLGVTSLVLRRVALIALSKYAHPWSIEGQRMPAGWRTDIVNIGGDANGAHILRELLTSTDFGCGYGSADIDGDSFNKAADALWNEKFGLSFNWHTDEPIEEVIKRITDHLDAELYVSNRTGKHTLKLIRDDFNIDDLFVLDDSVILDVENYQVTSSVDLVNQLVVEYLDRTTNKIKSVTLNNIAAIQANDGKIYSEKLQYHYLTNEWIAKRIGRRELAQRSIPLGSLRVKAKRLASKLNRGDAFIFSWKELGIERMTMRVVSIDFGEFTTGHVMIEAVQDSFSLQYDQYEEPTPSIAHIDPISPPLPATRVKLSEAPLWIMARSITGKPGTGAASTPLGSGTHLDFSSVDPVTSGAPVDPLGGFLCVDVGKPTDDHFDAIVKARQGGDAFKDISQGGADFTPYAALAAAVSAGVGDAVLWLKDANMLDEVEPGTLAYVGSEIVLVKAIDLQGSAVTVARGMLDTVPADRPAGTAVWFFDASQFRSKVQYLSGETLDLKLLPVSGKGVLEEADAEILPFTFGGRQDRPYPPANVLLNGLSYPDAISGALTVSWSHRDRLQQTTLLPQTGAGIGPEPGTTYTLRLYGDGGALLKTESGIKAASYTWDSEAADSGGSLNHNLRIELESWRDGKKSWQAHSISVSR